jgi:hypothetical protein
MIYQIKTFYGYDCEKRCNQWLKESKNIKPISVSIDFTNSMIQEKGVCVLYEIVRETNE